MLPLLIAAVPSLIQLAEKIVTKGEGSGAKKKHLVLSLIEAMYDAADSKKIIPNFEGVDEKRLVLRTVEVWIEELVPSLVK